MDFYRTFVGLPVKVGDGVLEARQELLNSLDGERISWVDPARYHVTLRFIGNTEISVVGKIGDSLLKEVEFPRKTHLQLQHLGSFGPRRNPRVIWIGFEETPLFESLKHDVDRVLGACGIAEAGQSFRAHLTLGRVRSLKDPGGFYRTIERMKERFEDRILFDRLVYYRSEPGAGGPVYIPLKQIGFRN